MRLKRPFGILGTATVIVFFVVPTAHAAPTIVSSWNMDETSGRKMLDQKDSNDGRTTGVTRTHRRGSHLSYGFNLTSVQSSVRVPNNASLNPGSADVSFKLHLKTTAVSGTGAFDFDVLRKGFKDGTKEKYRLEMVPSAKGAKASCVFVGDLGKGVVKSAGGLNDGAWHAVTCAKTATTVSVTVDGVTTTKTMGRSPTPGTCSSDSNPTEPTCTLVSWTT